MLEYRNRFLRRILFCAPVFLFLLVSCGHPSPTGGTSGYGTNAPQASTSLMGEDPSGSEAQKSEFDQVEVAVGINNLSVAPLFLADKAGYFKEEGIELKIVFVEGTGPAVQALVGQTVPFAVTGSGGITKAAEAGIDLIAIHSTVNRMTQDFVIRKEVLERLDVTPESPIEERFRALEGLNLGITSPGAPTDVYTRYYLSQAGLEPQVDAKIIAIGSGPSETAALKQGIIDGFMATPPEPQIVVADGAGEIFISGSKGEVPGLEFLSYVMVATRRSFAEQNTEIVRGVARALARANNLILDRPEEALSFLQDHFANVPPDILKPAFESVANAVPRDGKMNEVGWVNAIKIDKLSGQIQQDLDPTERLLWTNEYLP